MDPHALKFGGFHCPLNLHQAADAKLKSSMFHDRSYAPITKIFGSIKNKLPETKKEKLPPFSNSSCAAASALNQPLDLCQAPSASRTGWAGKKPMHAPAMQAQSPRVDSSIDTQRNEGNLVKNLIPLPPKRLECFRCLASGHWARNCTSSIRYRFCVAYRHIEKFCKKKKNQAKSFWRPRRNVEGQALHPLSVSPQPMSFCFPRGKE
jgi:hypothetical protein